MTALAVFHPLGMVALVTLMDKPYGSQATLAITDSLAVVFYTFAHTPRDGTPFMFTCPAVQPQLVPLLWRHLGSLVALIAFQTLVLTVRPHLPYWWNTPSGNTPFATTLIILWVTFGTIQVVTNRRLLNRSHQEFYAALRALAHSKRGTGTRSPYSWLR